MTPTVLGIRLMLFAIGWGCLMAAFPEGHTRHWIGFAILSFIAGWTLPNWKTP